MVTKPEYPNGLPLFTYLEDGRRSTIGLTYPEDGSPPLPLTAIRAGVAEELVKEKERGGPSVRFYEEYLQAMDKLIAQRSRQT